MQIWLNFFLKKLLLLASAAALLSPLPLRYLCATFAQGRVK